MKWQPKILGRTLRLHIIRLSYIILNSLRALLRMRGSRPLRGINFITWGEMAAVSTGVLSVGERLSYSPWKRLVFATTCRVRQCYVTIIISTEGKLTRSRPRTEESRTMRVSYVLKSKYITCFISLYWGDIGEKQGDRGYKAL